MNKFKLIFLSKATLLMSCFYFACLSTALKAEETDDVISISAQEIIGLKDVPVVHLELTVQRTRDLYVAVQELPSMQTKYSTMKRISKSGKYHFEVNAADLMPGKYRLNAYLTPKGKNWNDRIGTQMSQNFDVVNEDHYVEKVVEPVIQFSKVDGIRGAQWPAEITDNEEHVLTVKFDISKPRDLHIKLLSSENWQEFGSIKHTMEKPQDFTMPFNNIIDNFDAGKYAWVIYLTDVGSDENLSEKKFGKHFIIKK